MVAQPVCVVLRRAARLEMLMVMASQPVERQVLVVAWRLVVVGFPVRLVPDQKTEGQ